MSRTPMPQSGACRRPATTVVVATLLCAAVGVAAAPSTATPTAPATSSQLLQQRFTAAVEGWRKVMLKLAKPEHHEAQVLREMRVVVAPTSVPLLRVQRRLDGHKVVVSAGWLALLDELLRAEAVSKPEDANGSANESGPDRAEGGGDCLRDYAQVVRKIVKDNLNRAAETPPRALRAWPRLASLVGSDAVPSGCAHLKRADLQRAAVQARVENGADAAVIWLMTRQAALLVALPVPTGAAAATSSSGVAAVTVPADKWGRPPCTALVFLAPPQTAATGDSTSASESTAGVMAPPPKCADQRALDALYGYRLANPRALRWLRDNASELFDAETEQALHAGSVHGLQAMTSARPSLEPGK